MAASSSVKTQWSSIMFQGKLNDAKFYDGSATYVVASATVSGVEATVVDSDDTA